MTPTTIPVTITPEAAARVTELGMQAELDQMLEHTRQTVPCLRSIEVQEALPYDTGDETTILILATLTEAQPPGYDRTDSAFGRWKVTTFPPDVCRYFVMMTVPEMP